MGIDAIRRASKLPAKMNSQLHRMSKPVDIVELPAGFSKDNLKRKGIDKLVIHPDNPVKSVWEVFIIFCVLYTAIVEPLKVAYLLTILPQIDDLLDIVFAFDICFQCFCGYHDSGGQRFPVLVWRMVNNSPR